MTKAEWVALPRLVAGTDAALLIARVTIGAFLIWGVWDNIVSAARMAEFTAFLAAQGFAAPAAMARLSVYAQFLVRAAFIAGIATRWAGIVCAVNFLVALAMVDAPLGIRPAFPATALVLFGLIFATTGAGSWSIDKLIEGSRRPGEGWRE